MTIERDLGMLIRRLNPYTDGKPGTMQLTRQAAKEAAAREPEAAKAAAKANARAAGGDRKAVDAAGEKAAEDAREAEKAAVEGDAAVDLSYVELEVDNNTYAAADWTFKGQSQSIKRAIRIKYCYPARDKTGKILGWVTEHVIVGYAGANGG